MRVVVAGGTGFVGSALVPHLRRLGHEVVVLTRGRPEPGEVRWDAVTAGEDLAATLRGAGAVINLAGASISHRWTGAWKRLLRESRVRPAAALVGAAGLLPPAERPAVYVSASGVDYYGDTGSVEVDESSPAGGSFLAGLCVEWESAARAAATVGMRVVCMRTGVVFSAQAEPLRLLALPYRLYGGGPLGGGRQYLSWIHLADLVRLYTWVLDAPVVGPVNAVAPDSRTLDEVGREIGRILHRPHLLPVPGVAMRLLLGEEADVLLHGRRAIPAVALAGGFEFKHGSLASALRESLGS